MKNEPKKQSHKPSMLELFVGMAASALLAATLTHSVVTSNCEREMNRLKHDAVFERVEIFLDEWQKRAYESEQVDRYKIARQYRIPLTERGEIDYQALQHTMFP